MVELAQWFSDLLQNVYSPLPAFICHCSSLHNASARSSRDYTHFFLFVHNLLQQNIHFHLISSCALFIYRIFSAIFFSQCYCFSVSWPLLTGCFSTVVFVVVFLDTFALVIIRWLALLRRLPVMDDMAHWCYYTASIVVWWCALSPVTYSCIHRQTHRRDAHAHCTHAPEPFRKFN